MQTCVVILLNVSHLLSVLFQVYKVTAKVYSIATWNKSFCNSRFTGFNGLKKAMKSISFPGLVIKQNVSRRNILPPKSATWIQKRFPEMMYVFDVLLYWWMLHHVPENHDWLILNYKKQWNFMGLKIYLDNFSELNI